MKIFCEGFLIVAEQCWRPSQNIAFQAATGKILKNIKIYDVFIYICNELMTCAKVKRLLIYG